METDKKLANSVILLTVVIVIQSSTYGQIPLPSCSEKDVNTTECCLRQLSNCSDFKTLYTKDASKCQLPTTSTEALTSVDTTPVVDATPVVPGTSTFTAAEDEIGEVNVTVCVKECPIGYFEDENEICRKCDELCKNCTLDLNNKYECLECKYGQNSTGDCCPKGTEAKSNGNITTCEATSQSTTDTEKNKDTLYIIIGCVAGGVAVIIVIVVVVVCLCCCRRSGDQQQKRPVSRLLQEKLRRRKNYDYPDFQLPSAKELEAVHNPRVRLPGSYENTATLDHRNIAVKAQQEQDKFGRYTKDPTGKKKKQNPAASDDDGEPQETYENQPTIDLHQKHAEVQKKKKGPFNKISKKFRSRKGHKQLEEKKETSHPLKTEPMEEYEDVNSPAPQEDIPMQAYEDVGSGQPDFPQETYEPVDPSLAHDDMPTEEYTAMDPSTLDLQPQEEYQPMKVEPKPTKSRKQKKKAPGVKNKGADNPTFSEEKLYENFRPGAQQTTESENPYQNYKAGLEPEEEYVNY